MQTKLIGATRERWIGRIISVVLGVFSFLSKTKFQILYLPPRVVLTTDDSKTFYVPTFRSYRFSLYFFEFHVLLFA